MTRLIAIVAIGVTVGLVFPALAQLTDEQQLGQQGIDFLNSLGAGWAVAFIFVARQVAEVGAKLIPDSATGFLAIVRKVLKLIAVYVPNKS